MTTEDKQFIGLLNDGAIIGTIEKDSVNEISYTPDNFRNREVSDIETLGFLKAIENFNEIWCD
ncbi:hypothetical protein [Mammaliicoccus sciuri]|uniref:hypothetical protein n=1 Tax=Mammaliicoccus sciuri TaxID=1296 RepID=UPI00162435D4|nr:hypothetical protein [Mammaliicoccus sciuri]